jgi:hypothetical protein
VGAFVSIAATELLHENQESFDAMSDWVTRRVIGKRVGHSLGNSRVPHASRTSNILAFQKINKQMGLCIV